MNSSAMERQWWCDMLCPSAMCSRRHGAVYAARCWTRQRRQRRILSDKYRCGRSPSRRSRIWSLSFSAFSATLASTNIAKLHHEHQAQPTLCQAKICSTNSLVTFGCICCGICNTSHCCRLHSCCSRCNHSIAAQGSRLSSNKMQSG